MIYDVSVPIDNGMPVWPTDPAVSLTTATIPSIDRRRTIRVTSIRLGSHTGTHIDAPNHFVEGGKKLHQIPLKWLVGVSRVVFVMFEADALDESMGHQGAGRRDHLHHALVDHIADQETHFGDGHGATQRQVHGAGRILDHCQQRACASGDVVAKRVVFEFLE